MSLTLQLPLVAMRGMIMFPNMLLHFDVGRDKSIKALDTAMAADQMIFLVAQKDMRTEDPTQDDVFPVGVVSRVKQVLKLPGDNIRVLATGEKRGRLIEINEADGKRSALVELIEEPEAGDKTRAEAQIRTLVSLIERFAKTSGKIVADVAILINEMDDPGRLCDLIAGNLLTRIEDKQRVLSAVDIDERVGALIEVLSRETEIAAIESEIQKDVKKEIERSQKEYYLREQIKVIQRELSDGEDDAQLYEKRIEGTPMSDEAREKALRETARLQKMSASSPEAAVITSYLDWLLSLPWGVYTSDDLDIDHAQSVLDRDHYGLDDVKERVLEYLAVRALKGDMHGPILCFVGPPGTGKTSIARSIAAAVGRRFVRTSLGGLRDEAEIRGHRRTYIGAIPGRVISSIKQAGSMNPVLLFDEIDKMSSDFRGDPASAMLEVLDPEQNSTFRDHYLDIDFDLSQVMFITTANTTDTIPRPLLDRMEVIELSSYMENEKLQIARRHFVPKQRAEHGLSRAQLSIDSGAIRRIIDGYTSESGVRALEREIATVCRKAAREIMQSDVTEKISVRADVIEKYLGVPKYDDDVRVTAAQTGVAMGLAWTSVGGKTLPVEAVVMEGGGELILTGSLGDVMQESAQAAAGYIRAHARKLGVSPDFHKKKDIHIHCPSGAVPKDGPSAGITMATAMLSALTGRKVRGRLAMTGEITLTGNVLPIGGLKEKTLAALRSGVKTVIIPAANRKELSELPEEVTEKLTFVPVSRIDEVFDAALMK